MITKVFRADRLINTLDKYGSMICKTIYKIWVVLFILTFVSSFIKIPAKIITWVSEWIIYSVDNGLGWWLVALVFAPFYLYIIIGLILLILSKMRKYVYSQERFTETSEAKILKKVIREHSSSETTTYSYFVLVNHPVFHNSIEFSINAQIYNQVNEGDSVTVSYMPNDKNSLLMTISI